MAKVCIWGQRARKPLIITGYVLAVLLEGLDLALPNSSEPGRAGIIVLLLTGIAHVIHKMDRNTKAVRTHIDDGVIDVWHAGGRANERRRTLNSPARSVDVQASVHRLPVRP